MLFAGRGFDGFATAGVELQKVVDLIFGFGVGGKPKTGRGGRGAADVGVACNKLQKIESDIFGAAGSGENGRFHRLMVAVETGRRKPTRDDVP